MTQARTLRILVVDDSEFDAKKLIEPFDEDRVERARTLDEAVAAINREWPDVIILDCVFPESDPEEEALEFMADRFLDEMDRLLEPRGPGARPSVLLVSSQNEAAEKFDQIVDWLALGRVRDILPKTAANVGWKFFQGLLKHRVERFRLDLFLLPSEKERREAHEFLSANGIVTRNPRMLDLYDFITRVVRRAVERSEKHKEVTSVVIEGPSGSGKELAARAIWQATDSKRPFIAVNCADTDILPEAKLFGHKKGAFTGAVTDNMGAFEAARNGFLFLDQVECLPKEVQAKLLRLLEDRKIPKLGARPKDEKNFLGKLIAACEGDLDYLRREERLSEAFYHRLVRLRFALPPLVERTEDVPLLVRHFLREYESEEVIFEEAALAELERYSWPGNVRELRNVIYRLTLEIREDRVGLEDVHRALYGNKGAPSRTAAPEQEESV